MKLPYTLIDAKRFEKLRSENQALGEIVSQSITFLVELQNGNLEQKPAKFRDHQLSVSLMTMQDHLKKIDQREKEKKWTTDGFAQFIDIIRNSNADLGQLSDTIIKYLVHYLNANQGGLFLLDGEAGDEFLILTACYAYDRKKFLTKRINPGEGLVGECYLQKEMIYMTQVPKGYTSITSGLGDATPSNILLVPLKAEDKVMGVIEFASFQKFQPFHFDFLEKLGETIASQISMSKINAHTSALMESYKGQAETLRSQEEEMKQSMEELMATQEVQARLEKELKSKLEELELAKKELEMIKRTESERMKKQSDLQAKIMQSTIEKYKKREAELLKQLQSRDTTNENYSSLNFAN